MNPEVKNEKYSQANIKSEFNTNPSKSEQKSSKKETESSDAYKELDDLIGHLGWYQALICLALIGAKPFIGLNGTLPVFEAARPAYRCRTCFDSVELNNNITENMIEERFFDSSFDDCKRIIIDKCQVQTSVAPDRNYTSNVAVQDCCYSDDMTCSWNEFNSIKSTLNYTTCENYVYDRSVYQETIVTEFDLVCGRAYLSDLSTSMYYSNGALIRLITFSVLI